MITLDRKSSYKNENIDKPKYKIKDNYDYTKSTEENYSIDPNRAVFVGKYGLDRKEVDYNYHKHYIEERQLFHDKLIDIFLNTIIYDGNTLCDRPSENWIVFTAGPMGAGKSYTIEWLHNRGLFPLKAFVRVDPDALRDLLPETEEYNKINHDITGKMTQKEVGYISEVLILDALDQGKNVLVDGSLRDYVWYRQYILKLRKLYPTVKVCILHVTASEETVIKRAMQRAEKTGRYIPLDVMQTTIQQINKSMEILTPLTNFAVSLSNEEGYEEPQLLYASERVVTNSEILSSCSYDSIDSITNITSLPMSHVNSYANLHNVRSFSSMNDISIKNNNETNILPNSNWQESFRDVWKMTCILPSNQSNRLSRKYK